MAKLVDQSKIIQEKDAEIYKLLEKELGISFDSAEYSHEITADIDVIEPVKGE
jgi:hypothetical protein